MLDAPSPELKNGSSSTGKAERGLSASRPDSKRNRRVVYFAALAVLLLAAGFGAWARFFSPVKVQVLHLASDVAVQVFGLGTVEARITSKVGFKISGILVDLRADVGDRVAKGAVLARLDDREQKAQVARSKAAVEQAEANLQKANASVQKAQANYENAKRINERRQALVQSKSASVETAETAQAAQEAALGDLNLAKSDVSVAKAAISDAKAQEQQQEVTLDFHTLTAPYDAMLTARLKERGAALAAGEPVFTLIDPKTIWVLAYIDESKSLHLSTGRPLKPSLR
jgi:HlyD family secretion protein